MPPRKRAKTSRKSTRSVVSASPLVDWQQPTTPAPEPPHNKSLPYDLFFLVLDSFAASYDLQRSYQDCVVRYSTLCSCALTCRGAVRRSQLHLYADIWLFSRQDFKLFSRTLQDRASLGLLVRSLRINLWPSWSSASNIKAPPLSGDVVARMANLQKLDLAAFPPSLHPSNARPNPHLASFLMYFAHSSKQLTDLTLRTWAFGEYAETSGLARMFPHLEALSLMTVSWLSVGTLSDDEAQNGGEADGLRKLVLEPAGSCFSPERWDQNMPLWSSSLSTLHFEAPYLTTEEHHYSGLALLSQLVNLQMTFTNEDIGLIAAALRYVESKRIRRLTFVHHCQGQGRATALYQLRQLRLDDLLAVPPYEELTCLYWRVYCKDDTDAGDLWTRGIQRHLKGCLRRGILWHKVSAPAY